MSPSTREEVRSASWPIVNASFSPAPSVTTAEGEVNRQVPAPAIPPGSPEGAGGSANLLTYLGVLSRRKWVMLPAIVLVPLLSVALTLRQAPLYEATAELF